MKTTVNKNCQLTRTIENSPNKQVKEFVDNRLSHQKYSHLSQAIQKRASVIQRGPAAAKLIWNTGEHQALPFTYENVILYGNENLRTAWNDGGPNIIIPQADIAGDIDARRLRLQQKKEEWRNAHIGLGTLTERRLAKSQVGGIDANANADIDIDYTQAMIGRDRQDAAHGGNSLLNGINQKIAGIPPKLPFTLSAFLRVTNRNWSLEMNLLFLQMMVLNRIPVTLTSHQDFVQDIIDDQPALPDAIGGTYDEIKYLVASGYQDWQDPILSHGAAQIVPAPAAGGRGGRGRGGRGRGGRGRGA